MEILTNFSYANSLLKNIVDGVPFDIREWNTTGPRKSAKSNSIEQFAIKATFLNKKVKVVVVRHEATQAVETFKEYLDTYNEISSYYQARINFTQKQITLWNKNYIRVLSVNKSKKSNTPKSDIGVGLTNLNCDYAILHFEEAHQFSMDEMNAIIEALRGYKHLIICRSSNPWSIKSDYIAYCNRNLKYDPNKLMDNKGTEQWTVTNGKLFHYSRYENNPFITLQEKEQLEELKKADPKRARISCFGLPGIAEGGIYADYLDMVKDIPDNWPKPNIIIGGVDWGETKSSTSASIWGIGHNNKWVAGYDSYHWSNLDNLYSKTNKQMAEEVVSFYVKQLNRFPYLMRIGLKVEVDYAAFGVIDLLQLIANERGHAWLKFEPCLKLPIHTRIDIITALMSLGIFYLDKRTMSHLLNEMDLSVWDTDHHQNNLPVRLKESDHQLDAMEYALAPFLYGLIANYDFYISKDNW